MLSARAARSQPEFNGKCGVVTTYFVKTGRFLVELEGYAEPVSLNSEAPQ